jgi:hypothetical protein
MTPLPYLDMMVLLSAFGTSEGYFVAGTPPNVNNNPGDLRWAGQDGAKESTHGQGFACFDSIGRGVSANLRQFAMDIQRGDSLRAMVYRWAPPTGNDGGNNSALYLSETIRRIKAAQGLTIDPDQPLWNYLVAGLQHIP